MDTNINYGYNEDLPTDTISRAGSKRQPKKAIEKSEAIQLLKTGLTQKEISKRVGVTEKTLGKWAKECRQAQKIDTDTIINLKDRLLALSVDKTTPIQDIVSLMLVIEQLGNI